MTGNPHDAQDLVQVVLLRMYLRWDRVVPEDPLGYARRALVNERTDRWRRQRGREILRDELPDGADHGVALDALGDREDVLALLGLLTPRQRSVLVLRYCEDLSEEQTAQLLGVAVGTVKSTASRALSRLRVSPEVGGAARDGLTGERCEAPATGRASAPSRDRRARADALTRGPGRSRW